MRKLAAVLTAYLLMNVVLAAVAGAVDFGDVPQGHWAREEIRYVTDRGIFLGRTADTFHLFSNSLLPSLVGCGRMTTR